MHNWLKYPLLFAVTCIIGCASGQGIVPRGGDADKTPPKIISISPENGTLNFKEGKVVFIFDKYIQEETFENSLDIAPPSLEQPEFNWSNSGRQVEVILPKLSNDKTYALTVGNGTSDTYGNKLATPVTMRFSTGNKLDSGRIFGKIYSSVQKKILIFCYNISADNNFNPTEKKPDYIANTNSDGSYSLEALPSGKYRIIAINDDFNDKLYSLENDAFGVANRDIEISDSIRINSCDIRVRKELDIKPPEVFSLKSINCNTTEVKLSEPVISSLSTEETGLINNFKLEYSGKTININNAYTPRNNVFSVILEHDKINEGKLKIMCKNLTDTTNNKMPDSLTTAETNGSAECDTIPYSYNLIGSERLNSFSITDTLTLSFNHETEITYDKVNDAWLDVATIFDSTSKKSESLCLKKISPQDYTVTTLTMPSGRGTIKINFKKIFRKYWSKPDKLKNNFLDSVLTLNYSAGTKPMVSVMKGKIKSQANNNARYCVIAKGNGRTYQLKNLQLNNLQLNNQKQIDFEFPAIPQGDYEVMAFQDDNNNGNYDFGSVFPFSYSENFVLFNGVVKVGNSDWTTFNVDLIFK